ncbi:hypothetical protein FHS14_003626 [Paenibacillus baekrokdamisoli]|uniref:hypothetical protein n=1 Tax=Paenibacillus baekrokdamisoli TaxID=1712516 RepID=UPI000F79ED81|nr:hypothetical protein [Paenibacillus baekrokdamisoli]MBB3070624.1 hypothetical protein [Paenibacillus baekrokdamisoli]
MTFAKLSFILGLTAGFASIVLWFVLNFHNSHTGQSHAHGITPTFIMVLLPAAAAIISSFLTLPRLMMLAFIWSLPLCLYLILTQSVFVWFGVTCLLYLICYFLMRSNVYLNLHSKKGQFPPRV